MKRTFRWALLSVGLAGAVAAITVATGGATPPSMLTNVPSVGRTVTWDIPSIQQT